MRTRLFILTFIFIITGCIKQHTKEGDVLTKQYAQKSDILTKEVIVQFDSLFNAWEKEIDKNLKTRFSSNTRTYTTLPQFKELKAMGKKIIPCIIKKFEKGESTFFALPLYDELQDNDSLKSYRKTSEQEKVDEVVQKFRKQERKEMWEEANRYKASITDTTFLKTRGVMSYTAIDALTGQGFNKDCAFNQVVYLKALQRAQKHLSIVNDRLVCDLKSGAEIYISEDLYLFITNLFKDWNAWLKSGKFEIAKDEQGLYTVLPKKAKQSQTASINNSSPNCSPKYDFNIIKKEQLSKVLDMEVQMKTEKKVYSTEIQHLTVIVDNPTDMPLLLGRNWKIEVQNQGNWIMADMKKELCWNDDGLMENETYIRYYFKYPIGEFYELKKGKYRIRKTFSQNNEILDLEAEFEIK